MLTHNENIEVDQKSSASDGSGQYYETTEVNPDKTKLAYLKNKASEGC